MSEGNGGWIFVGGLLLAGLSVSAYHTHARKRLDVTDARKRLDITDARKRHDVSDMPKLAGPLSTRAPDAAPPGARPLADALKAASHATPDAAPARSEERALRTMTQILYVTFHSGRNKDTLWRVLSASDQDPFLAVDHQAHTGDLAFIRTNRPPPGTRYFHAQYFSNIGQGEVLQHMSFELKPSPEALKNATAEVRKAFPHLGEPTAQGPGFVQWNLDGEYVIWVKRLGANEIENNPFNAYSAADVGSVRIAIELGDHE